MVIVEAVRSNMAPAARLPTRGQANSLCSAALTHQHRSLGGVETRWQRSGGAGRRQICPSGRLAPGRPATAADSCPGGPPPSAVLVLPGFLSSSQQYGDLLEVLRSLGYIADVVPMAVADWFPVMRGGSFEFYLERADAALTALHSQHGRVALVGHSAGGWLARLLLGLEPYQGVRYGRQAMVSSLVTLGSPHLSLENYPFGRTPEKLVGSNIESLPPMVRGSSLQFTNHCYPSADCFPGVHTTCVCGDSIRGRHVFGQQHSRGSSSRTTSTGTTNGSSNSTAGPSRSLSSSSEGQTSSQGRPAGRLDAWFAYESYKSGCSRGDVDGDGVTPLEIAFWPKADKLILPGVWHMRSSRPDRPWYGDPAVVALWAHALHELPAEQSAASSA